MKNSGLRMMWERKGNSHFFNTFYGAGSVPGDVALSVFRKAPGVCTHFLRSQIGNEATEKSRSFG